ncbi:microtubule-associated tumor suppressor 1 homolog A isoform X2 [Poecilia latipinna]|uniref:Microtubule associated scaffold protein 1 n=1 Tax=Poecilia latipinna TaxID=48699 RepID=A0A3B3U3V0_9TELE|nr:PREDICTED: microtubule-associated tumor suppressor 1 isoform X2 [Poecilia latipinna]
MDYRGVGRKTELESSPDSTMAKTFNLPSDPFESSADTPPRDGQLSTSPDSDGISSLSEREASGSPYINTDHCLNEHSSVGNSHTFTSAQQDLLTVVTSNMNETFINAPVIRSPDSQDKSLSLAHHGQTGPETDESSSKHGEQDDKNEEIASNAAGGEGKLSSSDTSCCGYSGNGHILLSSGEMVVRSHGSCLEDQCLVIFSSMEESSVSATAGTMSLPLESIMPDVCKASTEQETKESMGHPTLGVTFNQANSLDNLTEEIDTSAFDSHVPLPSEGGLFLTFICETPTDQTNQVKSSGADAELLPQVTEEFTSELGKTFGSTVSGAQDSDGDIHTSTPVQCIANKIPNLSSLLSPFNENVNSPSLQLEKRKHIFVASKECPVAGLTPSICKVKKTESQKVPISDIDTVKYKDLTRMTQRAAVPGTDKLQKSQQVKKNGEVNKKNTFRFTTTKVMGRNTGASATSKTFGPTGQVKRAAASGLTGKSSHGCDAVSLPDLHPAVQEYVPVVQCSESNFEGMPANTSQVSKESAQHAGGLSSTSEMSSSRRSQVDPKPTPKKGVSNKTGVGSGSAVGQDRMWARRYAEGLPKDKKATQGVAAGFPASRDDGGKNSTKAGSPKCPSQLKHVEEANSPANNSRGVKKTSLVAEASKSAGAHLNENKSRTQDLGSPRQNRGAPRPQPPAASPRLTPLSARSKRGALRTTESRITGTAGKAQTSTSGEGSHKVVGTEETSTGIKLHQNAPKPPQTPGRSSLVGRPVVPVRPPKKISVMGQDSKNTPVSGRAAQKSTPIKSSLLKAKLISAPSRNNGSATLTAASTSKGSSSSAVTPLKKTNHGRLVEQTYCGTVDKNKAKTVSRQHQQQPSQQAKGSPSPTAAQDETKEQIIHRLKELLTDSNCRFQALAIVLQQNLAQCDDATTQCRELSQELVSLKGELACSVHSSECLEREKEELRAALQDATRRLQEEHQQELADLEQKLQAVHRAEWDHVHLNYQEEANKYKALMQQQMEELKANQEAMKVQLESRHAEQLQSVRQQYELSLEELRRVHAQELQSLEQELKDSEAALSKDSHTLYLEQELESLKVVLEMKNKQLHKQEKKLMDVGKLTDKKVQLDEMLIKVQQENEDLKARMERHAALSRQLSTEQALLQESLQKESKVNKRLSMENEELLWKLHNGDVGSPRRLSPSPTSPPHPFKLQSPRASGFFSSPPLSPR